VALAGGAAAIAFFALKGTADVMDKMVPANANVYVTAYLDPGAGQKLALLGLSRKFPALANNQTLSNTVNEALDKLLEGTGLRAPDVRPWLGTQVSVVVRVQKGHTYTAVMIASKNDQQARAAMAKFRAGPEGKLDAWSRRPHGGVMISVGTSGGTPADAYALVGHTAVLANDPAIIDDIIDTREGKMPSLTSSANYAKTFSGLPRDRLRLSYVDLEALLQQINQGLQNSGIPNSSVLPGSFGQLDAFTGLGVTLTAHSNGLSLDASVLFNPGKLTADQRAALSATAHQNAILSFTPAAAYGVFAETSFRQTVQAALHQFSDDPSFAGVDQELGLTEAATHLSGDAGLESEPGTVRPFPAAAFMAGTDDEANTRALLDKAASMLVRELTSDGTLRPGTRLRRETVSGTTVAFLDLPELRQFGVAPAYAVTKGMAIIASSPEEIRAALSAQSGGSNVASTANFRASFGGSTADLGNLFYLDVEAIGQAVRNALPPDQQLRYDSEVGQYVKPVKAFAVSSGHRQDRQTTRFFLLIP